MLETNGNISTAEAEFTTAKEAGADGAELDRILAVVSRYRYVASMAEDDARAQLAKLKDGGENE